MRDKLLLVYHNVALLCVLLVGGELAGQVLFLLLKGYPLYQSAYQPDPRLQWHRRLLEPHPYLVGRLRAGVSVDQDHKTVTTTALHTRWTGAEAGNDSTIRIAVIGGSTTFGAGVSDSQTWPARLQAKLGRGYTVTNFGLLGYSTAEGVIQMGLLVPETRPDMVILYEGWNDIRSYHETDPSPDYYSHGMRQFSNLGVESRRTESLIQRLSNLSAICRLAALLSKKIAPPTPAPGVSGPLFSTPDSFVDRIYLRNLRTIKVLARQTGAYTLLVPQVVNQSWYDKHPGGDWWTPHIENHAMPTLVRRFDAIMDQACAAQEPDCEVVSAVLGLPWRPEHFLDGGHFSPQGSEVFATEMAHRIQDVIRRRHPRLVGGGRQAN